MSKPKQFQCYIYPKVHQRLVETKDYAEHGLSFAVNAELSRAYGLEPPLTPSKQKGEAARRISGESKNHHVFALPENWFELLEALVQKGDPWFRRDFPQFSNVSIKCGLIKFLQNRGALPTRKLKTLWAEPERYQVLRELYLEKARSLGYKLKLTGGEDIQ